MLSDSAYNIIKDKREILATIILWMLVMTLSSMMLMSLSMSFKVAFYISLSFLPGIYLLSRVRDSIFQTHSLTDITSLIYPIIGIIVLQMMLVILTYCPFIPPPGYSIWWLVDDCKEVVQQKEILFNPIFVVMLLAVFSSIEWLLRKKLKSLLVSNPNTISFISNRTQMCLSVDDIMYIESNDTEVWIHTTNKSKYRNKTCISKWELQLNGRFHRIHRSFLVNDSYVKTRGKDTITISDDTILPVSRKYKDTFYFKS